MDPKTKKTPVKVLSVDSQVHSINALLQKEKAVGESNERHKKRNRDAVENTLQSPFPVKEDKKKKEKHKKMKRNAVKNTLQSPFLIEWPETDTKDIIKLLKSSCKDLTSIVKPPWKELQKFKREERKQLVEAYENHINQTADPQTLEKIQERKDALSHLIFGYNAVMRALEKDQLAGILLKKEIKPDFLMKAFIPGCTSKNIPLAPISNLDHIFKKKSTLHIRHGCMVVGLKPSVKEVSCRFHSLYQKMMEDFLLDKSKEEMVKDCVGEESKMEIQENETNLQSQNPLADGEPKENKEAVCNQEEKNEERERNGNNVQFHRVLTADEIEKYYLKRNNREERIFKPRKDNTISEDFIAVSSFDDNDILKTKRTLVDRSGGNTNFSKNTYTPAKQKRIKSNPDRLNRFVF